MPSGTAALGSAEVGGEFMQAIRTLGRSPITKGRQRRAIIEILHAGTGAKSWQPKARGRALKGKGCLRPPSDGPQANGPATRGALRAGLAQRAGSGRIGIGPQRPAGQGCGQGDVMDFSRQIGRGDAEHGSEIHGRAASEAVAAARKPVVMPMLMERRLSVVLSMLLRAGLGVSAVQMKRSVGVAADESERQQQD